MKILAIDTSGTVGSVATCEDRRTVLELVFERGLEHGRMLVPKLDEVLQATGWRLSEVELIAVSQGPGSYTGLRVGLTCAKTLAAFSRIPLVGVPSLDVLAQNAPRYFPNVCPVLDAKRGQLYTAFYSPDDSTAGEPARRSELLVLTPPELLERLARPAFVLGDGLRLHRAAFCNEGIVLGEEPTWRARAGDVGRLAPARFAASGPDDPLQLVPIYLRRPEAEEKWEARMRAREQGVG